MDKEMKFDYSALEGKIKQYYDTQDNFAQAIPMARSTLNQKLQGYVDFTSTNIYRMCDLLHIDKAEVGMYFFTLKVWKTKQN